MLEKKGIRYLRFSQDKQSFHSIERQDMITAHWMTFNNVACIDTFKDEGYTARNFDRPDMKLLLEFVRKNFSRIDYLVVSELTRFSRETGDAINMVKRIQKEYGIRIVSAGKGTIYDCLDHNSFFMMGLEFLMGNSENIKRSDDISSGIYTAKAVKGLYVRGKIPYGYRADGTGKNRRLKLHPEEGRIVKYFYTAFLANVPFKEIYKNGLAMGYSKTGNSSVQLILKNPLYYGHQFVKPYKNQPGGLFPLIEFEPAVDFMTWKAVQDKFKGPEKVKVSLDANFPLRGVLKCHCGVLLTGAPSRSATGNYYNYYKCKVAGHNNINVEKAQKQLEEALKYMSLPARVLGRIKDEAGEFMERSLSVNSQVAFGKRRDLKAAEEKLDSLDLKWINNEVGADTYSRWHDEFAQEVSQLRQELSCLERDGKEVRFLLQEDLAKLSDLRYVYTSASGIAEQQELLRKMFDHRLYYRQGVYRTPFMMSIFRHSALTLSDKKLLEVDGNNEAGREVRLSGEYESRTRDLLHAMQAL
jgi:site-specific DNA recombinase